MRAWPGQGVKSALTTTGAICPPLPNALTPTVFAHLVRRSDHPQASLRFLDRATADARRSFGARNAFMEIWEEIRVENGVKGHEDLPRGGRETCLVTVTRTARSAAVRSPGERGLAALNASR
jgi:hypothetical protein